MPRGRCSHVDPAGPAGAVETLGIDLPPQLGAPPTRQVDRQHAPGVGSRTSITIVGIRRATRACIGGWYVGTVPGTLGSYLVNPFVYDRPLSPDLALRRQVETDLLVELARGGQSSRLVAPRRYGKTTLVGTVGAELASEGFLFVHADFSRVR